MKFVPLVFLLLLVQLASSQIPAGKVFPSADLFGEKYGKAGVDPLTLEYLNGKEVEFEEHVVTIVTYFDNGSDNLFSVSFHEDEGTIEAKFRKSHAEFLKKRKDLTSEIKAGPHGEFFTLQLDEADPGDGKLLVEHRALIHNVMFGMTGFKNDKRFRKWIEDYSEYLAKACVKEAPEYKAWEGANGKVVKGHVHGVSADKKSIRFETEDGTIYPDLSLSKFSEKSRKEILEAE